MKKQKEIFIIILIIMTGVILFIPYSGKVHLFDWDEINFAEAAREMITTGDWFTVRIDYQPFHEKPPLFFWLQAVSMKAFGINEFAARLPNAIAGIFSLLFIYLVGKKIFDFRFGILWTLIYVGSFLPHFYFKTGLIDPVFNLFIFIGIYYISKIFFNNMHLKEKYLYKNAVLAGVFISLSILTKGPVGYLLPFLCWLAFAVLNRKSSKFYIKEFFIYSAVSLIPIIIWYAIIFQQSNSLISEFILYQIRLLTTEDAGHGGPIYYHFVVLLLGCFPASILMLRAFKHQVEDNTRQKLFKQFMIILLCIVLIVFSLVKTKIIHYSSLAYFPVTFLATYAVYSIIFREKVWKTSSNWLLGILGFVWGALFSLFPLALINIDMILPRVTDKFTHALLMTKVQWNGYEYIIGIIYLIGLFTSIILLSKRNISKGIIILFSSTIFVMFTFLPILAPKIEQYLQGSPIEFYQNLKNRDCYIQVLGYKSYAHYFYSEKPMRLSAYYLKKTNNEYEEWLLNGNIDKPAFFVTKNKGSEKYYNNKNMKYIYEKNGFVFFIRNKLH